MPVDATVEIMLETGQPSYARGDIVDIYRTDKFTNITWNAGQSKYLTGGGVLMPKTGYVHVTGIPNDIFGRLKRRLTKDKFNPDVSGGVDPHSGGRQHKRRWRLVVSELATPVRDELLADREITRTWIQFKNKTKHKISGVYLADSHLAEVDPDPDI